MYSWLRTSESAQSLAVPSANPPSPLRADGGAADPVNLRTRTIAQTRSAPRWMPSELMVTVQTVAARSVPYAVVEGDCGVRGRTDAEGVFVGVVSAGVCRIQAMREDGLLRVWSEVSVVELAAGERLTLELSLPDEVQGGVGIAVEAHETGLLVVAVRPGSPAETEGLEVGDVVTHVDAVPTVGWSPRTFAANTMGPVGSLVTLRVEHAAADSGQASSVFAVSRIWLPPGAGADTKRGPIAVQSLTDAQRRELEAIRDEYLLLAADGALEPDHPDVVRLREQAQMLADRAATP
ncbi:MAG TPA: hypothetical protein DFR83_25685 [Deltaproteobacteria bacterium]|nr:hypothetical protein [Deltaproteobacteria bacterium]